MSEEEVWAMRRLALDGVRAATGRDSSRRGGSQTYRTSTNRQFHLRTRQRDPQNNGFMRYWFGIRDGLWQSGDFFVLACDLDFVLVVPVTAWLPHMDKFSISHPNSPEQNRQPHIYWMNDVYELREGTRGDALVLNVHQWVNNFNLLV